MKKEHARKWQTKLRRGFLAKLHVQSSYPKRLITSLGARGQQSVKLFEGRRRTVRLPYPDSMYIITKDKSDYSSSSTRTYQFFNVDRILKCKHGQVKYISTRLASSLATHHTTRHEKSCEAEIQPSCSSIRSNSPSLIPIQTLAVSCRQKLPINDRDDIHGVQLSSSKEGINLKRPYHIL